MELEKLKLFRFEDASENYSFKVLGSQGYRALYIADLRINDIDKAIEFLQNVKKQLK